MPVQKKESPAPWGDCLKEFARRRMQSSPSIAICDAAPRFISSLRRRFQCGRTGRLYPARPDRSARDRAPARAMRCGRGRSSRSSSLRLYAAMVSRQTRITFIPTTAAIRTTRTGRASPSLLSTSASLGRSPSMGGSTPTTKPRRSSGQWSGRFAP